MKWRKISVTWKWSGEPSPQQAPNEIWTNRPRFESYFLSIHESFSFFLLARLVAARSSSTSTSNVSNSRFSCEFLAVPDSQAPGCPRPARANITSPPQQPATGLSGVPYSAYFSPVMIFTLTYCTELLKKCLEGKKKSCGGEGLFESPRHNA
jgi:hypothetical protein